MFKLNVCSVNNLPSSSSSGKTKIYIISACSRKFLYAVDKASQHGNSSTFSIECNIPFFHANTIIFDVFSSHLLSKDAKIGRATLDIFSLIRTKILPIPTPEPIKYDLHFDNGYNSNATISITLFYTPMNFPPVSFPKVSDTNFHVFLNYSPCISVQSTQMPAEIEFIDAWDTPVSSNYILYDINSDWEPIGGSTLNKMAVGPTGPTQIITIRDVIQDNHFYFFIVKTHNYKGTISMIMYADNIPKVEDVPMIGFCKVGSSRNESKSGNICKIEFPVEANKFYFVHTAFQLKKCNFSTSYSFTHVHEFSGSDPQIFYQNTIKEALKTNCPHHANIWRQFEMIPLTGQASLTHMNGFYHHIVLRNGGCRLNNEKKAGLDQYWTPFFFVLDKSTKRSCPQISSQLTSLGQFESIEVAELKLSYVVEIDLNTFNKNRVYIYGLKSLVSLEEISSNGALVIEDVESHKILFRNRIVVSCVNKYAMTIFRFEFVDNNWAIIPMWEYHHNMEYLDSDVMTRFLHNWVVPDLDAVLDYGLQDDYELIREERHGEEKKEIIRQF